jgi:hypothetical protein
MIRALTIPLALAALAVSAAPALAGTSNTTYAFGSEPTAGGGRPSSAHVAISQGPDSDADGVSDPFEMSSAAKKSGRLSIRFSWRTPNPRREQEFQLIQAKLAEAGLE